MKKLNETEIQKEYIAQTHFIGLKQYLERTLESSQASFPYIVSFRKTGEYSVLMQNAGAASKPHSILDKTIKKSSMTADELQNRQLVLLYGLVAHRNTQGEIDGLYLATESGKKPRIFEKRGPGYKAFVSAATGFPESSLDELDHMEPEAILAEMADEHSKFRASKYACKYITGDYDLHDLIGKTGQIHPVPSDSAEEARALNDLNTIMMTGRRSENTGHEFMQNPFYPVQHGPQYNYIAHMYSKEPDEKLVEAVAKASFPVLMLNIQNKSIEWLEIETLKELQNYYTEHFIEMKYSWKDDFPAYIAKRQSRSLRELMENPEKPE